MSTIQQQIYAWKETASAAANLALVRLQLARLDLLSFKDNILKAVIFLMVAVVLFFLAFITLLFGLNAVVAPEYKGWVFFGLAAALVVVLGVLAGMALSGMRSQKDVLHKTLADIQDDLAFLRGHVDAHSPPDLGSFTDEATRKL